MVLVSVVYFSCFGNLEREIAKDVEAGSLGKHSHAFSSPKKFGVKLLEEAVEEADELKDEAIVVEFDGLEEEPAEDEAEDPESEGKENLCSSCRNFSVLALSRLRNDIG